MSNDGPDSGQTPSALTVRAAGLDDHDAIMALMGVLQPADAPVAVKRSKSALTQILASDGLDLFVAEKNGCVVGTCYLNVIPNLTRELKPYALIENVVSDPSFRGQGIGAALLGHACEAAHKAGCYKVMLLTGRKDPGVHAFYRRCGFDGDAKQGFYRKL